MGRIDHQHEQAAQDDSTIFQKYHRETLKETKNNKQINRQFLSVPITQPMYAMYASCLYLARVIQCKFFSCTAVCLFFWYVFAFEFGYVLGANGLKITWMINSDSIMW